VLGTGFGKRNTRTQEIKYSRICWVLVLTSNENLDEVEKDNKNRIDRQNVN
jgi:hypothetical protein